MHVICTLSTLSSPVMSFPLFIIQPKWHECCVRPFLPYMSTSASFKIPHLHFVSQTLNLMSKLIFVCKIGRVFLQGCKHLTQSPNSASFSLPSWKRRLLAPPHPWHPHRERLGPGLHPSPEENPPALSHAHSRPGGLRAAESCSRARHARGGRRHPLHGQLRPLWPSQSVRALHPDGRPEPEPWGESREALVVELLRPAGRACTDLAAQTVLKLLSLSIVHTPT